MKNRIIMFAFALASLLCATMVIAAKSRQNSSIIGTWLSEKDPKWKMVFTADRCNQYYDGALMDSDYYYISNTSPQCGKVVPIDNYTSYMRFVPISGTGQKCYEINGITAQYLSLRPVENGKILVFVKQ